MSKRFVDLKNLGYDDDDDDDVSKAWENLRENIKVSAAENLGYYKLK
jgi:hypothetical protein